MQGYSFLDVTYILSTMHTHTQSGRSTKVTTGPKILWKLEKWLGRYSEDTMAVWFVT